MKLKFRLKCIHNDPFDVEYKLIRSTIIKGVWFVQNKIGLFHLELITE